MSYQSALPVAVIWDKELTCGDKHEFRDFSCPYIEGVREDVLQLDYLLADVHAQCINEMSLAVYVFAYDNGYIYKITRIEERYIEGRNRNRNHHCMHETYF